MTLSPDPPRFPVDDGHAPDPPVSRLGFFFKLVCSVIAVAFVAIEAARGNAEQTRLQAAAEADRVRLQAGAAADQVRLTATAQAEATRLSAGAVADATKLQGSAEASAIEAKGSAEAGAQRKMADALTANPALSDLKRAERWNGALPQTIYGSAPLPFMFTGK